MASTIAIADVRHGCVMLTHVKIKHSRDGGGRFEWSQRNKKGRASGAACCKHGVS
jgi:hypothetical protein